MEIQNLMNSKIWWWIFYMIWICLYLTNWNVRKMNVTLDIWFFFGKLKEWEQKYCLIRNAVVCYCSWCEPLSRSRHSQCPENRTVSDTTRTTVHLPYNDNTSNIRYGSCKNKFFFKISKLSRQTKVTSNDYP